MNRVTRSVITALFIAGSIIAFSVGVVSPLLPPVVGPPDLRESKSLNLPSVSTLRLNNTDGWIRVRTVPEASGAEIHVGAEIRGYIHTGGAWDEAKTYVDGLVFAEQSDDALTLTTERGVRPRDLDLRVNYTITVPEGTHLEVAGGNGNVWVSQGCGAVDVRGGNSDIEIVRPRGDVLARSTNGRIRVVEAAHESDLETVNGNIYAHMEGGVLDAHTANGHIVSHVLGPKVESFDLTSQNGGITVVFWENPSARVKAVTERGFLRSDFPIDDATGILETKSLDAVLGEGAVLLNLETLNGNIWIARG